MCTPIEAIVLNCANLVTCLATMAYVYTARAGHVTVFSVGRPTENGGEGDRGYFPGAPKLLRYPMRLLFS